jgi:hypothetical protein
MRHILILTSAVAFLLIALFVLIWTPAGSAVAACRQQVARMEGYAIWQLQAVEARAPATVITYRDGFNTATCVAKSYGPIWVVTSVGQTMVGCGMELSATPKPCPRRAFGVSP